MTDEYWVIQKNGALLVKASSKLARNEVFVSGPYATAASAKCAWAEILDRTEQKPPTRKEIDIQYRKFLRDLKAAGLKTDDIPDNLQPGLLALHQNSLLVWMQEHKRGIGKSKP